MSVNKVILIGRLGNDPEIKTLQNDSKVANFSLATSDVWYDKETGEKKEATEWHRVVVWGKKAELVEKYLQKGSEVYLEGKLKTRSWEEDGITRYATEIVLQEYNGQINFIGSRQSSETKNETTNELPF